MPRRTLVCLLLILAPAFGEAAHVAVARAFHDAFRARDQQRQATLAARSGLEIPFTLAVDWLLKNGEEGAAEALAELRGGPEQEGLKRMVQVFRAGHRPTREQLGLLATARDMLKRGRADEAEKLLALTGKPVEGTLLAVQAAWLRAQVMAATSRPAAAAAELKRCADLARAIGWFHTARDAEHARIDREKAPARKVAAAQGWVEACRKLNDEQQGLEAHLVLARFLDALATQPDRKDEALRLRQQARAAYLAAIEVAARLGLLARQAQTHLELGIHWHRREGRPREALKAYRDALRIYESLKQTQPAAGTRRNIAVALRQMGRYADALGEIDRLLEVLPADDSRRRADALRERGYLLTRLSRTEQAVDAYDAALAAYGPPDAGIVPILLGAGELQRLRGDLRRAAGYFDRVLARTSNHVDALLGRARVRGTLGDEEGSLRDFQAALLNTGSREGRIQVLLLQAATERGWGRIGAALKTCAAALQLVKAEESTTDFGNAAALYLVLADLHLLRRDYDKALASLAAGGTLFFRLDDAVRAGGAYAREVLLDVMLNKRDDAQERLGVLKRRIADVTPSDRLKSTARAVEAMFLARTGDAKAAVGLLQEAEALAREAGDPLREATALVHRALIDPDRADGLIPRALALIDGERVSGPEDHPLVEGERADHAAGIGLRLALATPQPNAAEVVALIERARAERLLLAFRGREALLAVALPEALHRGYLAARGGLVEARALGDGVKEAETAFDAAVEKLRREVPAVAALAFSRTPSLADLQASLKEDEALVLMLDDPYVRAIAAVDRERVLVGTWEQEDPLAKVADLLAGKRRLHVAPDGMWAVRSMESAPLGGGVVADRLVCTYFSTISSLLHESDPSGIRAVFRQLEQPARFGFAHPQASGADGNVLAWLRRGCRAETVVIAAGGPRRRLPAGASPRFEGVAVVAEALRLAGARSVVVSLAGAAPPDLLARFRGNCLEGGLAAGPALQQAREWFRKAHPEALEADWAGLIRFGR